MEQDCSSGGGGPEPPLRVAFFMHGFEMGGAQRRSLTLAGALVRHGVTVDLVVVSGRGPLRGELPEGVGLVALAERLADLPWIREKRRRRVRTAVPALAAYLRRVRPDVLVAAANHAALAAAAAHRLAGRPAPALVLRVSNALVAGRSTLSDWARRAALARVLRRVDAVAAVSEDTAVEVRALAPHMRDRVFAVPNPVVDERLLDLAGAAGPAAWPDDGVPVVLGVGRLVPQKDFSTLVAAFARLRAARPARLVILGEGPERPVLEALAQRLGVAEVVDLPGLVPNPFVSMSRASLFVLSSRWEGMPGVLVEAMACGCAVVSTDCPGGAREVLRDGALGDLVPVGDVEALSQAMLRALEEPVAAAALRARAADFSVKQAAEDFFRVLQTARLRLTEPARRTR